MSESKTAGMTAVSAEEMKQVEGGKEASMSWMRTNSVDAWIDSWVRQATGTYDQLKRKYYG